MAFSDDVGGAEAILLFGVVGLALYFIIKGGSALGSGLKSLFGNITDTLQNAGNAISKATTSVKNAATTAVDNTYGDARLGSDQVVPGTGMTVAELRNPPLNYSDSDIIAMWNTNSPLTSPVGGSPIPSDGTQPTSGTGIGDSTGVIVDPYSMQM